MFVSENNHDKLVACTIIPFCEANLSDHLAMKLTMDLVIATPHMLKNNCNTLRSCIPKIDLCKTVNRDKYSSRKHLEYHIIVDHRILFNTRQHISDQLCFLSDISLIM